MKTLTTLAAIAALVAGVSFAQAQGTMGSPSSGSSSMQKSQTIGNSPFCINTSASGGLNCKYASLAACEKDAKPQNLNCSPNPNKSTTGSRQ
jgi:exo-beta-1,3-glucanase (GH17 family)